MIATSKVRRIAVGHAMLGALIGAMPAAICGIGVAVARQNGVHPYGHDLAPVANFLLYLVAPMGFVWAWGGVLLALNRRFRVLVWALFGALPGSVGSPLVFVFQGGCTYWIMNCFGDVFLLVIAFASMALGVSLGGFAGWSITHRNDMRCLVEQYRIGEVVRGAWIRLRENGVTKHVFCGTAPATAIATLLILLGVYALSNQPYASFYGESVIFFAILMLAIAALGGQIGALVGWLRANQT